MKPQDVRPARVREARESFLMIAVGCLLTAIALALALVRGW